MKGNQANNRDAGDLRRHGANYDVIVMLISSITVHGGCISDHNSCSIHNIHYFIFDMLGINVQFRIFHDFAMF